VAGQDRLSWQTRAPRHRLPAELDLVIRPRAAVRMNAPAAGRAATTAAVSVSPRNEKRNWATGVRRRRRRKKKKARCASSSAIIWFNNVSPTVLIILGGHSTSFCLVLIGRDETLRSVEAFWISLSPSLSCNPLSLPYGHSNSPPLPNDHHPHSNILVGYHWNVQPQTSRAPSPRKENPLKENQHERATKWCWSNKTPRTCRRLAEAPVRGVGDVERGVYSPLFAANNKGGRRSN